MKYEFQDDFLWGTTTSAAQIEGGAYEDGRGPSIWDAFCHLPGNITNGDTPDISCDSYHLYENDIQLMNELGVKSYRFSFSWSRILPEGIGEINPAGISYYKKLIHKLKENHIVPNATMYHWDLPYKLQLMGGFGNRKIVEWYTNYVKILFENFGEDIDLWVTFNEPISILVGYSMGVFAPGLKNETYARQCLHNLLVCHGEAVKLFRTMKFKNAKIGIVVDIWKHYPERQCNADDYAIAETANEINGYGIFLNPIFLGEYSKIYLNYLKEHDMMPEILTDDMEIIHQKIDFYGLNFYNAVFDNADLDKSRSEITQIGGNYQDKPLYHTEKLVDVLHMLTDTYHVNIPIYITENGLSQNANELSFKEIINDYDRIDYLKSVLAALHQAIQDKIPVKGYYLWSLLDNFEWSAGFTLRYGLYYTDFNTLERIPKKSVQWYRDLIQTGGFDSTESDF